MKQLKIRVTREMVRKAKKGLREGEACAYCCPTALACLAAGMTFASIGISEGWGKLNGKLYDIRLSNTLKRQIRNFDDTKKFTLTNYVVHLVEKGSAF